MTCRLPFAFLVDLYRLPISFLPMANRLPYGFTLPQKRAIRPDGFIKTRPHPLFGGLRVPLDRWQTLIRKAADQGLTVEQALALLPAKDPQYQPFLDAWPARQAFLQNNGAPGQLEREQALADHLAQLVEA